NNGFAMVWQALPQLLRDERHEGMQQAHSCLEDIKQRRVRLLRMQFDHLQIPVTELVPEKRVDVPRSLMQVVLLNGPVHSFDRSRQPRQNPSIDEGQIRLLQFLSR